MKLSMKLSEWWAYLDKHSGKVITSDFAKFCGVSDKEALEQLFLEYHLRKCNLFLLVYANGDILEERPIADGFPDQSEHYLYDLMFVFPEGSW